MSLKNQMKTYSEAEEKYRNELMKITIELNNNKEKMNIIELTENDKVNKIKSLESDNSILKNKLQQIMNQYNIIIYNIFIYNIEIIKKSKNYQMKIINCMKKVYTNYYYYYILIDTNIKCELNSLKLVGTDKESAINELEKELKKLKKYKVETKDIGINTIELPPVLDDLYKKNINREYNDDGNLLKFIKYPNNNNNNNIPPPPSSSSTISMEYEEMNKKLQSPLKPHYNNNNNNISEDLTLISTNMFNDRIKNDNKYIIYKKKV